MPTRCPTYGSLARRKDAAQFVPPGRTRPTSAARGYDSRWRKVRLMQLARHPLCTTCQDMGKVVPATEVHHIIPIRDGGRHALANLLSLCQTHHHHLTARGE